jgi:hypothetical protein
LNKWMKGIVGAVVVGVLLLGVTTVALAADPTPTPIAPGTGGWHRGPMVDGPSLISTLSGIRRPGVWYRLKAGGTATNWRLK